VIIDLPGTTTQALNNKLVHLREDGGAVALGRVMTLVIVTEDVEAESAINAANEASREHPCRVLAVARGNKRGASRLDAQIRIGGDAGASEVLVLRLYGSLSDHGDSVIMPLLLPDAPVVVWWPQTSPDTPAEDPIGRMAQRRITDASAVKSPGRALALKAKSHAPGDTDLAWSRITRWRALLAAALDLPPYENVQKVTVTGASDSPSSDLLAAWLGMALRCPVTRKRTPPGTGMVGVLLERPSGVVSLQRPDGNVATLTQPGQPDRRIAMPRRSDVECLSEELRRLDPDDIFAEVVTKGLPRLANQPVAKAPASAMNGNGAGRGGTKKSTAKKSSAKKSPAKRSSAKKAPAKKASVRKAVAQEAASSDTTSGDEE
jgi:glucose-6-phosphate dehydrogenase assembly protein OpcA